MSSKPQTMKGELCEDTWVWNSGPLMSSVKSVLWCTVTMCHQFSLQKQHHPCILLFSHPISSIAWCWFFLGPHKANSLNRSDLPIQSKTFNLKGKNSKTMNSLPKHLTCYLISPFQLLYGVGDISFLCRGKYFAWGHGVSEFLSHYMSLGLSNCKASPICLQWHRHSIKI